MNPILKKLNETKNFIEQRSRVRPVVGLTLGSGLASFADEIEVVDRIPYSEIPHFSPPTVEGHPGDLIIGHIHKLPVAVLTGRIHFYEGHSMEHVVFPTRALGKLGVKTLILTNAAGGMDPKMKPGHLMLIRDHINLTGHNPLRGENVAELGPRFPDMTNPYDPELSDQLLKILKAHKVPHSEGVYCGVAGPCYETAAEVRYLQKIGGHAVGMSTVAETIAARHMGLKVVGLSCITNLSTGLSDEKISHEDVKAVAKRVEQQFVTVLKEFLSHNFAN